jgi:hypothetical protein
VQTHQDNVKQNVLLQLLALVGKQPAFHQLRSVEQLGYIALLRQRCGGTFSHIFDYDSISTNFTLCCIWKYKLFTCVYPEMIQVSVGCNL